MNTAREAGVNAFVTKPIFRSRMAALFHELLGNDDSSAKVVDVETAAPNDFHGRRALLVEDEEINAEIAREILENLGFAVDYAENGKEAVDRFSVTPDGYYDIIFMDVRMPVMNGYEATRAIRAADSADAATVPIIAMTANAFVSDMEDARNAGMNAHVAKPIDIKQLYKTLNDLLPLGK